MSNPKIKSIEKSLLQKEPFHTQNRKGLSNEETLSLKGHKHITINIEYKDNKDPYALYKRRHPQLTQ